MTVYFSKEESLQKLHQSMNKKTKEINQENIWLVKKLSSKELELILTK